MKYHINSVTGSPAKCRAVVRACPLGEHFATEALARQYFEEIHGSFTAAIHRKYGKVWADLFPPLYEEVTTKELAMFPNTNKTRAPAGATLDDEQAYLEWHSSITDDDRLSIQAYQGGESLPINNAFRYGDGIPYMEDDTIAYSDFLRADVVRHLDPLIEEYGSSEPDLVYHGMTLPSDKTDTYFPWHEVLVPGTHLDFKGYLSTSVAPKNTERFARPGGIIFELMGSGSLFVDTFEEERLFPRGTRWKIIAHKTIRYGSSQTEIIQILRKA